MPFVDIKPDLETTYPVIDGIAIGSSESRDDESSLSMSSDSENPAHESDDEVVESRPLQSLAT